MPDPSREVAPTHSPTPLHALHVVDAETFARFGRMFRQLGLALGNAGIDVSLLTDDAEAAAELDGTPVIDCLYPSFHGLHAWRLEAYLRRTFTRLPSVVHLWGTTCLHTISRWTASLGIPLGIHVTAQEEATQIERRGAREHEHVLTICEQFADGMATRWAATADAVAVMPPAILAPSELLPREPLEGRTLGIVWTGRIDRDARLDLLLDAAQRLRTSELDYQIALIGDGPASDQVWRTATANQVADRVSMTDGATIWDHALAGADIFVVPAAQRRISLAPLLAMASGTLVIASDDQLADWFRDGETAVMFQAGDAGQLAACVRKVACGNPAVSGVGRAARDYVRENHAIIDTAQRLAAMYRDWTALRVS